MPCIAHIVSPQKRVSSNSGRVPSRVSVVLWYVLLGTAELTR